MELLLPDPADGGVETALENSATPPRNSGSTANSFCNRVITAVGLSSTSSNATNIRLYPRVALSACNIWSSQSKKLFEAFRPFRLASDSATSHGCRTVKTKWGSAGRVSKIGNQSGISRQRRGSLSPKTGASPKSRLRMAINDDRISRVISFSAQPDGRDR